MSPQDLSDIFGKTGAKFVATVDAGTILTTPGDEPKLTPPGTVLTVGADSRSINVDSLPAGRSQIDLTIVFAPGEPPANVGATPVDPAAGQTGAAQANPGRTIPNRFPAAVINLFGVGD
jgi:hypothetical protein